MEFVLNNGGSERSEGAIMDQIPKFGGQNGSNSLIRAEQWESEGSEGSEGPKWIKFTNSC